MGGGRVWGGSQPASSGTLDKEGRSRTHLLAIIAILMILAGCSDATQTGNPAWVDKLIKQYESKPVANLPLSIWRYDHQEQVVYFVPARCCDIYSVLYDADGNVLCALDGGIAGAGDGRCTDLITQRTNAQLIWQDPRWHRLYTQVDQFIA